jgi:peptidoglycan-associated lipoprotein
MPRIADTGRTFRLALLCASAALIVAGCATTASYRPEIDSMRASLADAKAAGAETLAPEEYARAEACLDLLTHEATEFKPFADPNTAKYVGKCRAPFQALKDKMAAVRVAKAPAPPAAPPIEAPAPAPAPSEAPAPAAAPAPGPDLGIYPEAGTLAGALAALPAEAPPAPAPIEAAAPAAAPAPGPDLGIYPEAGTLAGALAALPAEAPPAVPGPREEAPPPPPPAVMAKEEPPQAVAPALGPPEAAIPAPTPTPPAMPKEAVPPAVTPPTPAPAAPPALAAKEPEKAKEPPLKDIFFDFDKAEIRPDGKAPLAQNIEWLQTHPQAAVTIEGHCDERGTIEYNLALGERRAKTTKDYLAASGVDPKRMNTVSFGKERPFVVGHDESAWQWNRRAHFVPR